VTATLPPMDDIQDMLRRLQGTDGEAEAREALDRYRAEGLQAAKDGFDQLAREQRVGAARERLRRRLTELLG
jgi:hypothetical protein